VRVLDGDDEVASHERSWERGRQIEDPRHLDGLADDKRHAREHRGRNRLMAACPSAQAFLEGRPARRPSRRHHRRLLRLLDSHGPPSSTSRSPRRIGAAPSPPSPSPTSSTNGDALEGRPCRCPSCSPTIRACATCASRPPLGAYDALARSGDKKKGGEP
jgi:hypothetical protein